MSEHVYKTVEITGSSPDGSDDAIRTALGKAAQSLRHIDWFEVVSTRGMVEDNLVTYFQVTLKVGFRLE